MFIGALALPNSPEAVEAAKLGTLAGSFLPAIAGWTVLRYTAPIVFSEEEREEAREIFGEDQDENQRPSNLGETLAAADSGMRTTKD